MNKSDPDHVRCRLQVVLERVLLPLGEYRGPLRILFDEFEAAVLMAVPFHTLPERRDLSFGPPSLFHVATAAALAA